MATDYRESGVGYRDSIPYNGVTTNFAATGNSSSSGSVTFRVPKRFMSFTGNSSSSGSVTFVLLFIYTTPQETEAHMSASLRQATPDTSDPQTQFVTVNGTSGAEIVALLGVDHGVTPGKGVEVVHADLHLTLADDMAVGSKTFTVKALDAQFNPNEVTYNTQPATRATTATVVESGLVAGDVVTIDITDIVSEAVAEEGATGEEWFGLKLTVSGNDSITFHGAFSAQYRPTIEKEVSSPPTAPFNMAPASGLAVSEQKPRLSWDFFDSDAEDTLTQIHVQVDATDDFETPTYDSGEVASTVPVFDAASPPSGSAAFANLTIGNTYYWQARHADNHGVWSDWGPVQSFVVTAKGTFAVDPVPLVPTPTTTWTLTGVTQRAYYVAFERYVSGTWVPHWEQPWTTGTTNSVTLPDAYVLQPSWIVRRTVRVTDTTDRADVPGDRSFYEDVEQFTVADVVMA